MRSMWQGTSLITALVAALAFLSTYMFLCVSLSYSKCSCVVLVTGESIRIEGCEFTPEFIEYAKSLAIPKIW